jgi:RNA polymerase sigma factor (sigma-70 family)
MVMGVCRRILGNEADADDVFQATFIVFIRRAGCIRARQSLGSWLYGVALRLAHRARCDLARRRTRETEIAEERHRTNVVISADREPDVRAVLDDELARLHERYRAPLVLCYLEGKTHDEAARQLGWPLGTVCGRLARGRRLLRTRLTRRGLAPAVAAAALNLSTQELVAAVPASLMASTIRNALSAANVAAITGASATVRALVDAMPNTMWIAKVKMAAAALLVTLSVGVGVAAWARYGAKHDERSRPADFANAARTKLDVFGDPLPEGAMVRFGSLRFRHAGMAEYEFLDGGRTVLTSGGDRTLRYWDVETGRQIREVKLQGTNGPGRSVSLSSDGKWLAAHDNGTVFVWEVASGKEVQALPGTQGNLGYLYFSPDGKTIAIGSRDQVVLWEWETKKRLAIPLPVRKIGLDSTFHACFSPDGRYFIAGGGHKEALCVFERRTAHEVRRFYCNARTSAVSPDSKRVAVVSARDEAGSDLLLFDLSSGAESAKFPMDDQMGYFALAFSPDGKTIACSRSDKSLIMDAATGRVIHRLPGRPGLMTFAPDGKILAGSNGFSLRFWDPSTGKELHEYTTDIRPDSVIAASPDGRLFAVVGWVERSISLWDTATARVVNQLPLRGEGRYVRSLTFSPDGRRLSAGQVMGFIEEWDVVSGKVQHAVQLEHGERPTQDFWFYWLYPTPDGKFVSTVERAGDGKGAEFTRLTRWDAGTGKVVREDRLPASGTDAENGWSPNGAPSPDGKLAALSLNDGLALVELASGTVLARMRGTPGGCPVIFSPDGRLIAARLTAGQSDGATVGVWESATGKEVTRVAAGAVVHLQLAPDDRSLLTTDPEFMRVWDLATGVERFRQPLPVALVDSWRSTFVSKLLLLPDGRRAFTSFLDGTALIWDVTPGLRPAGMLVNAPGEKAIAGWWTDLASPDSSRAYSAIWRLAENSSASVSSLRGLLKPITRPNADLFRRLIDELDSNEFEKRETAEKQLQQLGEPIIGYIEKELQLNSSAEVRRRLATLREQLTQSQPAPHQLQALRAIQVLEIVGTADARSLLQAVAEGAPGARLTEEAKVALARLDRRQTPSP